MPICATEAPWMALLFMSRLDTHLLKVVAKKLLSGGGTLMMALPSGYIARDA